MKTIIIGFYQAMAKLLSLPASFFLGRRIYDNGITGLILLIGLVLLMVALKGGYKTPFKHILGCGYGILLLAFHAMNCERISPDQVFHPYVIYACGGWFFVMVLYLIENFIKSWNKGVDTLILWLGDLALVSFAMRVWYQYSDMGKKALDYTGLYPLGTMIGRYQKFMVAHNFKPLIFVGEWICLLLLLAISSYILGNVRKFVSGDYQTFSGSIVLGTFIYMVFQTHDGYSWEPAYLGLAYGLAVAAQCTLLFLCLHVLKTAAGGKDVKAIQIVKYVVAMIEILFVAICMNLGSVFAVDIMDAGAVKRILSPLSSGMTWFYGHLKELDFGYQTNFLTNKWFVILGFFVVAFLIYIVVLFLFLILKLILGDLNCDGVALPWLRNCILVLVVPAGLYWFYSMCKNALGDTGRWISDLSEVTVLMGLMVLLANFVPAIKKKGFMNLVKWTLVSMVVCLLAVFALLPVLMVFA